MIVVIRIKGKVNISEKIKETLNRLRLRKKYSCVVLPENKNFEGMVEKIDSFVAYGKIDEKIFKKLIEKRGKLIDKTKKFKLDEKMLQDILSEKKKLQDFNLKPFFRLHPPRGGIKSKERFPRGVLGNHGEKINLLIERML